MTHLNPCDFDLWGTLKGEVYVETPHSFKELQETSSGVKFLVFPYSRFILCLETCSHDVRHV
jgi:hypothetical protein